MQDNYAGDIGDYGKFALLKAIEKAELSIGVNWYKSKPDSLEKNVNGRFLISEKYAGFDPLLSKSLYTISRSDERSIAALQKAKLLQTNKYYSDETLTKLCRDCWHKEALEYLSSCDLVYLDPDNGISVKSVRPGATLSSKYVFIDEVEDYIARGISVIFYNQRSHVKAGAYFQAIHTRLENSPDINGKEIFAVTFSKCTIRDYFLISANDSHNGKIKRALDALITGPFGKSNFCFIPSEFAANVK